MSESASHELDLPLLSNNEDITVYHYVLELHCHFERKQFEGNITIFCKPVKNGATDSTKLRGGKSQSGFPHLDHQYASQVSITTEDIPSQHTCSDNADSGNMSDELATEYPRCYESKVLVSESMGGTIYVPSQNIYKDKAREAIQPAESISHLSGCCEDNALSVDETKSQHPSYQGHTILDADKKHTMFQFPLSKKENASGTHCHGIGETNVKADDKNDVLPTDSARSLQDKTHITENPVLSTDSSHLNESSKCFEHARFKESGNEIDDFEMILDCWELTVERVEEVIVTGGLEDINKYALTTSDDTYRTFLSWSKCEGKELDYRTDKQCVKIRKKGVKNAHEFPRVVRLFYRTHPKGYSLKWTKDQDGRECVFTHGHWINNRSLFPSQDVPVAMATWQSIIYAPHDCTVLMSGDDEPVVNVCNQDWISYSFYTRHEMPSSTLCLAVGYWKQTDIIVERTLCNISDDDPLNTSGSLLPCRLFCPDVYLQDLKDLIGGYIPHCMKAANQMLGPYPFKRLDILLVPSSFSSLGMASPSLMFISQSLLSPDQEMCIRLAHELSHSWFGLMIGPRDWTEEWLSEGFCTYTELYLHGVVLEWTEDEKREQIEIRDYLKYKTLEAEIMSSQTELQTLRPNKGEEIYVDGDRKYVRNGMNPDKGFMQVHYLKGYFLLQHLERYVGTEKFHEFLRSFVGKFSGGLITSKDFISMYFKTFPLLRAKGITEEQIYSDWLDNPGLPLSRTLTDSTGSQARATKKQYTEISKFSKKYKALHWSKKRKLDLSQSLKLEKLNGIQLLLLMDYLVQEAKLHADVLDCIRHFYQLNTHNADIQHKWCELVVKNKTQQHYDDVRGFLVHHQPKCSYEVSMATGMHTDERSIDCFVLGHHDQDWKVSAKSAMGVYLFGELILSRDKAQRKLAEDSFRAIADDMEDSVYKTVHLMVYGT